MLASWMLHAVLIGCAAAAAAALLERACRALGWPGRWAWAAAALASVAVPLAAWLAPGGAAPALGGAAPPLVVELTGAPGDGGSAPWTAGPLLERMAPALAGAWAATTLLLAALVALSAALLRRSLARAPLRRVGGVEVRLTPDLGPAVVGAFPGRIVVPAWLASGPPAALRLVVAHEAEHLRVRDPLLRAGALLLAILFPWHLPLWWQLRRLRLALEMDCDARVLRGGASPRGYGRLLLEMGARVRRAPALALIGFSWPPASHLERRIRRLVTPLPRHPARRAALLLCGAAAVAAVALRVPEPAPPARAAAVPDRAGAEAPPFTPFTTAPSLLNRGPVLRALAAEYPPLLRDAGVSGTARVHFHLDARGELLEVRLDESSGHAALDVAALRVARAYRFGPALDRGRPVAVWISLPIAFPPPPPPQAAARVAPPASAAAPPPSGADPGSQAGGVPTFTPFTVAPSIVNRTDVIEAMEREYPPLLRAAAVGGTARVHFLIDARGGVAQVRLDRSSGHEALDEAALRVARAFRFTPALLHEDAVPVWISLPITFQAR